MERDVQGSHVFFKHKDGRTTLVPMHNRELSKGLLRKILNDVQLSVHEYDKLRNKASKPHPSWRNVICHLHFLPYNQSAMETKKFVAVLNKKVETGKVMNALAHMTVGLVSSYPNQDMGVINYADKDGGAHMASKFPYIILRADNSNKIRTLRNACIEKSIPFASFTSCMTVGGWEEQVERSKTTSEPELEYYGICLLGEKSDLDELTKKFSLWM